MKRISFIVIMLVTLCIVANADEWIGFNERGESAPIYEVENSSSYLVEFELEIPGMNSRDIDSYNRVSIPEHAKLDSIGFPEVPFVSYLIAIPECDNVNLNVTVLDSVVIDSMYIYPAPHISVYYYQLSSFCNIGDINGDGEDEILFNDGEDNGPLANTATIYGLQGSNAQEECKIENVKCKISNYPNPFNPETKINYALLKSGETSLKIFNVKGQLVKTLVNEYKYPGEYSIIWDGTDNSGKPVTSGVYYYRLQVGNRVKTKSLTKVK